MITNNKNSPISIAICKHISDVVKYYLKTNAIDWLLEDENLIHQAAYFGNSDVLSFILKNPKVNVNSKNKANVLLSFFKHLLK